MTGPQPVLPARVALALAVLVLPDDARDRYREELRTELCEIDRWPQIGASASLLLGSIALRRALVDRDVPLPTRQRPNWRCRIGRHAYVQRRDDNPELPGRTDTICTRCGHRYEPRHDEDENFDIATYKRHTTFFG